MPGHLHRSLPVTHIYIPIILSSAVPLTIKINTHFSTLWAIAWLSAGIMLEESSYSVSFFMWLTEWAFPSNQQHQIWKTGPNKNSLKRLRTTEDGWGCHPYVYRDLLTRLMQFREPATLAFYASEPVDNMTTVEDLIFRNEADIVYDPCVSSRRRRIEWPTTDTNIQSHLLAANVRPPSSSSLVPTSTKSIINSELAKCDVKGDLRPDLTIYDELFVSLLWRISSQNPLN